jgi:hypothetical protein
VLLVHNDFAESFQFKPGRYTSSFLKLQIEDGSVVDEIQPEPYQPGIVGWLRMSATFRYFFYTRGFRMQTLRDLVFGAEPRTYSANIDVDATMQRLADIRVATDYLIARMTDVADRHGAQLLFLMDGHRQSIYGEEGEDREFGPLALNDIAANAAARHSVSFVDLHAHFARDWVQRGQRFEHTSDWHWNGTGHQLAADTLAGVLGAEMCEPQAAEPHTPTVTFPATVTLP